MGVGVATPKVGVFGFVKSSKLNNKGSEFAPVRVCCVGDSGT